MQELSLWKKIRNEGVFSRSESGFQKHSELQEEISNAPVVFDYIPRDAESEKGMPWRWDSFDSLVVPYDLFWAEGFCLDESLWGCLVKSVEGKGQARLLGCIVICAVPTSPALIVGTKVCRIDNGKLDAVKMKSAGMLAFRHGGFATTEELATTLHTVLDNMFDLLQEIGKDRVTP